MSFYRTNGFVAQFPQVWRIKDFELVEWSQLGVFRKVIHSETYRSFSLFPLSGSMGKTIARDRM